MAFILDLCLGRHVATVWLYMAMIWWVWEINIYKDTEVDIEKKY